MAVSSNHDDPQGELDSIECMHEYLDSARADVVRGDVQTLMIVLIYDDDSVRMLDTGGTYVTQVGALEMLKQNVMQRAMGGFNGE